VLFAVMCTSLMSVCVFFLKHIQFIPYLSYDGFIWSRSIVEFTKLGRGSFQIL
jgi:hypothetical protein